MTEEKSNQVQPKDDIDLIQGHTNILLIAPHGVASEPYDDENTAELTQKIADILKCHPIINTTYRKPKGPPGESEEKKQARNNGIFDAKKKVLNLNSIEQTAHHPDFLAKIKKAVDVEGTTYVFWIHGIDDDNIISQAGLIPDFKKPADQLHALIGYGQGPDRSIKEEERTEEENSDSLTIEKKGAEKFAQLLTTGGINTELTSAEATDYCGRAHDNMNQWFVQNKDEFPRVKSLQLEIRKDGFRDTKNLDTTAIKIADAISAFVPSAEKIIDPLVETAYQKLSNIFSKNYEQALMEAGQYIVRTFYAEEITDKNILSQDAIENARNKKSTKETTLHQLFQKLDGNRDSKSPSRGWIYNAVNLVVQWHDMKKLLKTRFHTYGNLFLSYKVALLKVKKLEIKQALIEEESENPSTVKEFVQKIEKLVPPDPEKPIALPALLKKPEELMKKENAEKLSLEALKNTQARTLEKLKKIIKEQRDHVFSEINAFQQRRNRHLQFLEKYSAVENDIDKLIEQKKTPEKKSSASKRKKTDKKPTGFQEWTKKENTVNICTGCANDCKYCYAKSMAYRFGQVQEGQWANQIIRDSDVNKKRKLYDGRVGFPTSHDITPHNVDAYLKVLKKLLEAGNEVLIVSKPNLDCIKKICETGSQYKDKILFRFTIGAMNNDILRFWDTNAPLYEERRNSLKHAFDSGFQTSVSMEPLLDSANVVTMATELEPYVTDAIWIGKMNHTSRLKIRPENQNDPALIEQIETIENGQTDDKIKTIFADFQKKPELLKKIKWKDSFKKVLGIKKATKAGMDI